MTALPVAAGTRRHHRALSQKFLNIANRVTPHAGMYAKKTSDDIFEVLELVNSSEAIRWTVRTRSDGYHRLDEVAVVTYGMIDVLTRENYDSIGGAWNTLNTANHYATEVGATVTKTFTGTAIGFRHLKDNRGAIWEFVVDGDTANPVQVDTYAATASTVTTPVFSGLSDAEHTLVGTVVGVNPANVSGQTRGWATFNSGSALTSSTFHITTASEPSIQSVDAVAMDGSWTEIALSVRPAGTAYSHKYIPGHGTTNTVATSIERLRDGVDVVTDDTAWVACESILIDTTYDVWHPDDVQTQELRIATLTVTQEINATGATLSVDMEWLRDTVLSVGYGAMHASADSQWTTHALNSDLQRLDMETLAAAPIGGTWSPEGTAVGAVFYADGEGSATQQRMLWAWGWAERYFVGTDQTHFARNDDLYAKLYSRVYQSQTRSVGATESYSARYKLGLVPSGQLAVDVLPAANEVL